MKVALVGATGLVGSKFLEVLEELDFPFSELIPVASARSVGKEVVCKGKAWKVVSVEEALNQSPHIAFFSAGSDLSLQYAPEFVKKGTKVIDNSSAWRMNSDVKLVVPEVNGSVLQKSDSLIANPNCSTVQLVMALAPIHKQFGLKRVVISTYQSVTGTGVAAVNQLMQERESKAVTQPAYAYPIDLNIIPQIDVFLENGYTKEEMKMILETRKILSDPEIGITATAVRIPVMGGHSESVNVETRKEWNLGLLREIWQNTPGVQLKDDPASLQYPMPIDAHNNNAVWIGRVRKDDSQPNTFNLWIVSDNLRKGAATNAVQIALYLIEHAII